MHAKELEQYEDERLVSLKNVIDAYERKLVAIRNTSDLWAQRAMFYGKMFDQLGKWLNQKPHLRHDGPLKDFWDEYTRPKF